MISPKHVIKLLLYRKVVLSPVMGNDVFLSMKTNCFTVSEVPLL